MSSLLVSSLQQIKALLEEIKRLRVIEQTHLLRIHNLEELLETKRQHIARLERRLHQEQMDRDSNPLAAIQESTKAVENQVERRQEQEQEQEQVQEQEQEREQEREPEQDPEISNESTTKIHLTHFGKEKPSDTADFTHLAEHIHGMEIKKETQ